MALAYERLAEKYAKRIQLLEDKAQARRDRRRRGWKPKIRRNLQRNRHSRLRNIAQAAWLA